MYPMIHGLGQGPRLVVGLRRRDMVRTDASAFAELQRPAVDPGPAVPGGDLPVRTLSDVTKGLGLSYEAERDLTRSLEEWIDAPDPITFRSRVIRGLRGFAPDNYAVRNEVWRRASALYRSHKPRVDRQPGSVLIQKSGPFIGPRGGKWADAKHTIPWKEKKTGWNWASRDDIQEWELAGADESERSAKLAYRASQAGITPEKLQEKTDGGDHIGDLYFDGKLSLEEVKKIVGGPGVLFAGGWQVKKREDWKDHVFRVMDQDEEPVIESGQHVGSDVEDVVQYRSWSRKPGIFAFPVPDEADILDVSNLGELAEALSETRSEDEWIKRWEDVPHINHALGMDADEIARASRKAGYSWIRFDEPSGTTLGYVGEAPVRGVLIARDVSSKNREDERDGISLVEDTWGNGMVKSSDLNRWKAGEFLKYNPDPSEEKTRDFAREIGVSYEALKALFAEHGERIPGGEASGMKPDDFDLEQLAVGTHHELEHTADRSMAMEIAMDHLAEDPAYYQKLKQIEKSEDEGWGPMPGIEGGLRRAVQGGYEYRFPAAEANTPQPDPALRRIMQARPVTRPPELLFCYSGDEEMYKGDIADMFEQLEKALKPEPSDDTITIRCRGDAGQTLAKMLRYMQGIASAGASRAWGVMGYTPKTDPDYTQTFGIDGDGADKITEVRLNGEVVKALVDSEMYKGAQHKYIKRIPTGKPRPKWRYIYKHPKRKGLVVDEHLVTGTKFKIRYGGELGHFEIMAVNEKKGIVTVKHDETGRTANIKKRDLTRMLEAHHAAEGKRVAAEVPPEERAAPAKLPRVQIADLARGEWEHPVGFEPSEEAALELARNLKKGWDYAAIKQPTGYLVVSRRQRGAEPSPRVRHGTPVKVHLRNEKPMSATYTLMEADDVVASHNPVNFNVRKDYPEGVQERPYHTSKHEQKKVMRIAAQMEPVFVINNNPDGVNGTPIITQDGVVLGGNARTMGIQRAYAKEPKSAKAYKNYLVAHAKDYGFNAADVRNMKKPVLVRRSKVNKRHKRFQSDGEFDQTKYNAHLRLLGRRMNEGLTQGLDPRAEEVALGKNFVNDRMLRALTDKVGEGETLDKFLQSERSRTFIKTLWSNGILDDLNAGQFTYSDEAGADEGLLNKEGRARLERILVGKMIDSPSLLDRMSSTQRQALSNSVVHIVVAQQNGWDVVPKLKRAIQIDQSIQKMEKELKAVGQPRKALKNFLLGKQTELPGVSGMVEEVRGDDMLRHLLIIVREKAGTTNMPRDFRGFALRSMEDAKKDEGSVDMFGGAYAAKREDPAEALDIEFGVTPPRAKEKAERRAARIAEEKRKKEERKRIKEERRKMAEEGLFGRSVDYEYDLIKAEGEPNRLVTRAVHHVELLVDAAVSTSMLEHGEIRVDGARIARQVLADIDDAIRKDPELAREQGRSPVDAKVVRGLVEAFVQIRGKDLLEKSYGRWYAEEMDSMGHEIAMQSGEPCWCDKCTGLSKAKKRPPGTGWTPPSGKRRSWRKRVGGKYVYWTARKGHHGEPVKTLFGEEHQPIPKPSKADRLEAVAQVEQSDEVVRADAIAERLVRHGLKNLPGKYAKAVESWKEFRPDGLRRIKNANGIEEIHERQERFKLFARNMGDKMREFETRQQTMFVDQPKEVESRELTPDQVKEHARVAYGLGASKDPGQFSRYMSNLVEEHGEAQAMLVMDQVAYLQEARRGKATARAPEPPKKPTGAQRGLFTGHQATLAGEQGELFRSCRLVVKAHVYR